MKVIEKEWNDYLLEVMPKDASVVQVEETRKAFYTGAGCLFYVLMRILPQIEPTEKGLETMRALEQELMDWIKE